MMKLIKKLLLPLLVTVLLTSMSITAIVSMINVTFGDPATSIYVNPSVVSGVIPPNIFKINISVTDAPLSYGWETFIEWDPAVLNVTSIREGDFLHRWVWDPIENTYVPQYSTILVWYPIAFDDANIIGQLRVTCSLFGDAEWASGNGWLLELGFKVKAQPRSTRLNLYDTSLYDRMEGGAPAPTLYPNSDGYFSNTIPGDITGPESPPGSGKFPQDGKVDTYDLAYLGKKFGTTDPVADFTGPENPPGSGNYPPDGTINTYDLAALGKNFGKHI